jgi:hypothetical protein
MLPIIYMFSAWMRAGVNSTIATSIVLGLVSQFWLRRYHPGWYKKYNYILGGALDGGAQVVSAVGLFKVQAIGVLTIWILSDDLHPVLRGVRCVRQGEAIPEVVGESRTRQHGLLQRQWCSRRVRVLDLS